MRAFVKSGVATPSLSFMYEFARAQQLHSHGRQVRICTATGPCAFCNLWSLVTEHSLHLIIVFEVLLEIRAHSCSVETGFSTCSS